MKRDARGVVRLDRNGGGRAVASNCDLSRVIARGRKERSQRLKAGFPSRQRTDDAAILADDVRTLRRMGYAQELLRFMHAFSNYAISLSIICIVGVIISFHLGFCAVGGASIGLGWPLVCLFVLSVAATMGQLASAFPTAGGLYHWASILGGRFAGWLTAWFNLVGLITVLAGINVGTYKFLIGSIGPTLSYDPHLFGEQANANLQILGVAAITLSQAVINHFGIKLTSRVANFSGYWILIVATALTAALLCYAPAYDLRRLITFTNYSGAALPGHEVWPHSTSMVWLFALGFLLPAYNLTGFDASAHVSEETLGAARNVPRAMLRAVLVSGGFGWLILSALVLAIPSMDEAAAQGDNVLYWILERTFPTALRLILASCIGIAIYMCGMVTVTSASRMLYAFARDGGVPFSPHLRKLTASRRSPALAIWAVATAAVIFTLYTPVFSTIISVSTIFLYISYVLPTALGLLAYRRRWTTMGPWDLGPFYRPLAFLCVVASTLIIAIGSSPPNQKSLEILGGCIFVLAAVWFRFERARFPGPPQVEYLNPPSPTLPGQAKLE
jgi:amino acid transporter